MPDPPAGAATAGQPQSRGGGRAVAILKILGLLAGLVLLIWLIRTYASPYVSSFRDWVQGLGVWAPVVFIVGYIVATVAFVPGSLLTLGGGLIFGLLWGTVYVFIGASIGACLAFLIARYVARGWVEKKLEGQPKFAAIDRAIGREGGKIVVLMRLSPVFPFNLLNYALGLTQVRFWPYALACFAMLPGTFLYVYYGAIGREAATGGGKTVWDWVQLGVGLAATLAVTAFITVKARRALAEQTEIPTASEEETTDG